MNEDEQTRCDVKRYAGACTCNCLINDKIELKGPRTILSENTSLVGIREGNSDCGNSKVTK